MARTIFVSNSGMEGGEMDHSAPLLCIPERQKKVTTPRIGIQLP